MSLPVPVVAAALPTEAANTDPVLPMVVIGLVLVITFGFIAFEKLHKDADARRRKVEGFNEALSR